MNWIKSLQEGLKLLGLLAMIAVIIWTMPEMAINPTH